MTEQTRRNILRYGIAIDLVIMATGVGMLVPATAPLLIGAYAVAVALSVWKGGWKGGLTALLLSVVALLAVFGDIAHASHVAALIGVSIAAGAIVESRRLWSGGLQPAVGAAEVPVAVPAPAPEDFAQQSLERSTLAEVVPLRAAEETPAPVAPAARGRKKKPGTRSEAKGLGDEERAAHPEILRSAQDDELARVREEAARVAAEAEEARRRAEEEAARVAAEAEEARRQAEVQAAREREEAARVAAEAEEARRRAEEQAARVAAEAEDARRRAEEEASRIAAEAEEARRRAEEQAAREREEAARVAAEAEVARRRAEEEALRVTAQAEDARRRAEAQAARQREESARIAAEAEAARRAAEEQVARVAAEAEAARKRAEEELEQRLAREREAAQREMQERLETERRAAEEDLRRQLETERAAMRAHAEQELAAERERLAKATPPTPAATPTPARRPAPKTSILDTVTNWFRREPETKVVNLKNKRLPVNGNTTATRRPQPPAPAASARRSAAQPQKPRILLIERRRGTADTAVPKLRQRGIEVEVVERWVDAVDEIFRFKPNALFLDVEHPEFERIHRTVTDKTSQLPIILTGRAGGTPPALRHAGFVARPYDADELARLAQRAHASPEDLLAEQSMPRTAPPPKPAPVPKPVAAAPPQPRAAAAPPRPAPPLAKPAAPPPVSAAKASNDDYEVACYSCRAPFNAVDADWCSCLAKERSLVCTNCLACFCKAPPSYKEKFWIEAPPRLFERKSGEARRQIGVLPENPPVGAVKRPLVLCVEDDEEIQAIVQRVCANLGYGFIWAANGQDGLELARAHRPNLILSDAFMPKLDGREMCRILKEEPIGADIRMAVMTGLYTDTKYRSEAVKRFHIDDYIAKPVAITDLINLLQKHLEGVTGLPVPEDLHELHRAEMHAAEEDEHDDVPLSEILGGGGSSASAVPVLGAKPAAPAPQREQYDVCCFNCQNTFDATRAEWCSCVGRDNTLVCEHCNGCFCKAPAAYRERFWIDAPPSLFERKMIGSKRNLSARSNPAPLEVKRPLILLVEDDENVQLIVRTVVSSMGFGFVVGANGQEGLSLAREYNPDLILSDAFMPKLDGREMCRLLKEDPTTARSKAIIMTGLYTDRKYRNEALDYFKVDDYVAKPLAVDDLIKLFKKHLPQEVATAH